MRDEETWTRDEVARTRDEGALRRWFIGAAVRIQRRRGTVIAHRRRSIVCVDVERVSAATEAVGRG